MTRARQMGARFLRRLRESAVILLSIAVGLVLIAVVLDVAIDAPLRGYLERKMNSTLDGYTVHVGKANFHIVGLSLTLTDCVVRQNAHPDPPVMVIPKLSASVQWKALLSARLVADFGFTDPVVHINTVQLAEASRDAVPVDQRGWQDALQAIY